MFSNPNKRNSGPARTVAAILAVALVVTGIVPPLALAETDHEGEGTAPPGAIPGLEPGEPGGPETTLEEVAPAPGEGELEEVAPPVAVESAPPPTVVTEAAPPPETAPPPPAASIPPQPDPAAPVYGTEAEAPSYEPSPPPPTASPPVRNEAIVAPSGPPSSAASGRPDRGRADVPEASTPSAEPPAPATAPSKAPEPIASLPVPAAEPVDQGGELQGRVRYTVAPGDCLWSIATALLQPGAPETEILTEVARLWRMNAARIGTGDPNVILVGTVLRLG